MITDLSVFLILVTASSINFFIADINNKYHPVAWFGRIIKYFLPKLKHNDNQKERIYGILFPLFCIILIGISIHVLVLYFYILDVVFFIFLSILILNITISIKGLERHVNEVINSLYEQDIKKARIKLSMIVSRDTSELDKEHILSSTIESIGDSIVDGITSPLFYFSFFGPAGAVVFRLVSTLDSMIGYKKEYFRNIGWMSAKLDSFLNFIPARLTSFVLVLASLVTMNDWRNSIQVFKKDRKKPESYNSGYPMSVLAGALRIKLEKIDHYNIGVSYEPLSELKCKQAIKLMKITTILFIIIVSIPTICILSVFQWWDILFAIK